jgi:FkbH-like protein
MSTSNELESRKLESLRRSAGQGTVPSTRRFNAEILKFIRNNEHRLSRCFLDSALEWGKYRSDLESNGLDVDQFAVRFCGCFVDYLALYFRTGDITYRSLFVGELLKLVHTPSLERDEQQRMREGIVTSASQRFFAEADRALAPTVVDRLRSELEPMFQVATSQAKKTLDILCVGDCLTLDVVAFLGGPCREQGIDLNPTFVSSYNPVELRRSLRSKASDGFALVFYSPFTYTFSADYSRTLKSGRVFAGTEWVRRMIAPGLDEVRSNLDLIIQRFDCPILVHNSSNIRRHNRTPVDWFKIATSLPARRIARREANWVLDQYVRNLGAAARVSIIDECALLDSNSEWELGRRFYDGGIQHPTMLSRHLAPIYQDYLTTQMNMMTKKLLVCDLDNTLWSGEIGEGAVTHFHDRQSILKRLRRKGVLLAINSKNDAKNVHWQGSELEESDFVLSRINWNSKADNMREIRDTLNLKVKDFVFIDDRADQREMISASFPEIVTLDATSDRAWRLLDLWSRWLPEQDGLDRTQLYHDRERRENFIVTESQAVDPAVLMTRLGLKATIRFAKAADLKRVVDLINRTNQFNVNNSRTTLGDLRDWLAAPGKAILLVDGTDKFGQMGTVCVALTAREGPVMRIPSFVLSCRVFGYGFETAMLNAIARLASRSAATPQLIGLYTETPLNEPCRAMYPNHGFVWNGDHWLRNAAGPGADPTWLEVLDKTKTG